MSIPSCYVFECFFLINYSAVKNHIRWVKRVRRSVIRSSQSTNSTLALLSMTAKVLYVKYDSMGEKTTSEADARLVTNVNVARERIEIGEHETTVEQRTNVMYGGPRKDTRRSASAS